MQKPNSAQKKFQEILDAYGGETSKKSIKILLEDPDLVNLKPFLKYISNTWRDPFVPTLINLSCQAVNGDPKDTEEVAIALSLMNLSFRIWDDIIDKTYNTRFKTTFVGEFGEANSIIIGGVISAKAFTILNELNLDAYKKQKINELTLTYWAKMAEAETSDLYKTKEKYQAKEKMKKIKDEAINVKTCLKIGAIIGNGSVDEIDGLLEFGECLGIVLELVNDIKISMNTTLELGKKITRGKLPYFILEVKETSERMEKELERLCEKQMIEPEDIGIIVNLLVRSGVTGRTRNQVRGLIKRGKVALRCLKQIHSRDRLTALIDCQQGIFDDFL